MMDPDDAVDDEADGEVETEALAPDPFLTAIALCQIAERPKPISAALKRLRKVGRDIVADEAKLAAIKSQAEQVQAALTERAAELDRREAAISEREAAFTASLADAHSELYSHHNRVADAHRQLVYRIMSTSGILGNWNFDLQDPPSWEQLKRMVAGLPDDLPSPAPHAVTREVTTDWTGNHSFIAGSSLTRSVPS